MSFCFCHQRIEKTTRFANGRVCLNEIEGFWLFAKERVADFPNANKHSFTRYLKELEFRSNHGENRNDASYEALRGRAK